MYSTCKAHRNLNNNLSTHMKPMRVLHLLQGVSYLNFTHVDGFKSLLQVRSFFLCKWLWVSERDIKCTALKALNVTEVPPEPSVSLVTKYKSHSFVWTEILKKNPGQAVLPMIHGVYMAHDLSSDSSPMSHQGLAWWYIGRADSSSPSISTSRARSFSRQQKFPKVPNSPEG